MTDEELRQGLRSLAKFAEVVVPAIAESTEALRRLGAQATIMGAKMAGRPYIIATGVDGVTRVHVR